MIAAFLTLAWRCFYLQFFRYEHYTAACRTQQEVRVIQNPQRGAILDCRGRVLAASNKVQRIFVEPRAIRNPRSISAELAPIVEKSTQEIYELITESRNPGFVKIKEPADENQCIAAAKIRGIGVQSDWQRNYPAGPLVSHIVGFTSADNNGLAGVELEYDKKLRGSEGRDVFLADAPPFRRPVRPFPQPDETSRLSDGVGIILTIDATIQQFAREELMKQYQSFGAESAVAIVAEPKTGAILAMVSLPDFDPAQAGSADADHLRNRAITDEFEPGSAIKPVAAAVAIDCGAVGRNEVFFCEYGNYHGKGFGHIGEYGTHRFGDLTLREILINSSNIGMAKVGQKVGKDRLYNGMRLFGFGKKTGIDLPGEADGVLWPVSKWTGYSITRIPFGQEITVTAIQLIQAFSILANGGHLVRPYIVKAIVDSNGDAVKIKQPTPPVGFIIKPEVAKWIVSDALVVAVNDGTGKLAKLEKWQVFGKTGTANIAETGRKGYSSSNYVASFIGGAPADNPAIIVLVSIRKPNKKLGYTGGNVSAPVAGRIIEKTLNYLEKEQRQPESIQN